MAVIIASASPRPAIRVEIVSKIAGQSGFVLLPRAETPNVSLGGSTATAALQKDAAATIKFAAAFLYAAAAILMIRRLTRCS
jgi:hypothetical protein